MGTPPPMHRELETTAATAIAMQSLGIMPDSLEIPISQFGKESLWKYRGDPSKPTLKEPLSKLRMASTETGESDPSWKAKLQGLLQVLPDDVKEGLLKQAKLPLAERDDRYEALDALLGIVARALVFINRVAAKKSGKQQTLDAVVYGMLPKIMMNTLESDGGAIIKDVGKYLESTKMSNPHFDEHMRYLRLIEENLKLYYVAGDTAKLHDQLKTVKFGDDLHIMSILVEEIVAITAVDDFRGGTTPLMATLMMATVGFNTGEGKLGVIGPAMNKWMDGFLETFGTLSTDESIGNKKMLDMVMKMIFTLGAGIAAIAIQKIPVANKVFFVELALHFILASGFLEMIGEQVAEGAGVGGKEVEAAGKYTAMSLLLLMIKTAAQGNRDLEIRLIGSVEEVLKKLWEGCAFLKDLPRVGIFWHKGVMALEKWDINAFMAAWKSFQEAAGVNMDMLQRELKEVYASSGKVFDNLCQGSNETLLGKTFMEQA